MKRKTNLTNEFTTIFDKAMKAINDNSTNEASKYLEELLVMDPDSIKNIKVYFVKLFEDQLQ